MKRILLYAFISLATLLIHPSLFAVRLLPFAPLLAHLTVRTGKAPPYATAALCGLLFDLFTAGTRFGFTSLIALLATLSLFFFRRILFADRLLSLPLHTALFSSLFTFFSLILYPFFHTPPPFSLYFFLHEITLPPLVDGLYALLFFTLPTLLWQKGKKAFLLHFWEKRREDK